MTDTPDHPLVLLQGRVTTCRECPRLVEGRERVAVEKRAASGTLTESMFDAVWSRARERVGR